MHVSCSALRWCRQQQWLSPPTNCFSSLSFHLKCLSFFFNLSSKVFFFQNLYISELPRLIGVIALYNVCFYTELTLCLEYAKVALPSVSQLIPPLFISLSSVCFPVQPVTSGDNNTVVKGHFCLKIVKCGLNDNIKDFRGVFWTGSIINVLLNNV